jgi:hypothetical protein
MSYHILYHIRYHIIYHNISYHIIYHIRYNIFTFRTLNRSLRREISSSEARLPFLGYLLLINYYFNSNCQSLKHVLPFETPGRPIITVVTGVLINVFLISHYKQAPFCSFLTRWWIFELNKVGISHIVALNSAGFVATFNYCIPSSVGEGKAIPLQTWTGPEGSRRFGLPDFKTISKWR